MHDVPTVTVADLPDPLTEATGVVDVREDVEWAHGHIEGSVHIPLMELPQRLDELPTGHTLVVCRIGARSAQAAAYLTQQGLDVVHLDGGLLEWAAAGRPLVSDTGRPPAVV